MILFIHKGKSQLVGHMRPADSVFETPALEHKLSINKLILKIVIWNE